MREHSSESRSGAESDGDEPPTVYRDPLGEGGDPRLRAQLPEPSVRVLESLRAAIAAADYQRAVVAVRDGWFDLLSGDQAALRRVVAQLPHEIIRESPLLAMLTGLASNGVPHRRVKSLRLLVVAIRAASSGKRDLDAVDRALILTSASVSFRLIGQPKHGVSAARSALRILHELEDEQRESMPALPRLYGQLGTTLYYGGQVAEALSAFEYGLAEIPTEGYPHGFMNLAMLAGIHALRGELPEARVYVELARDGAWTDVVRAAYPGTFYRLAEATLALERFVPSAARGHIQAMVHDRRTIEHWIAIATTEALIELIDTRPGAALAGLDAFAALRGAEGRSIETRRQLAPTRALLQLALGNPDAARAILRREADRGPGTRIGQARVELALGRHGAALQHARAVAGVRMSPRELAELAAVEAAALLRFSDRSRSRAVVDHLGNMLQRTGQRLALTLVPESDYQRIRAALTAAGHDEIVASLPARSCFPDPDPGTFLTERELAVLDGLLRTSSVAGIASELVVSVNTVKTQLRTLYRKLGVSTRDEAIAVALDRHLVVDGGAGEEGI